MPFPTRKVDRIQVSDYSMKDTLTFGNRRFKKVIAQQVERVYPQVIRKQKGFIPNVYQQTTKIQRTDSGYLLTFNPPSFFPTATRIRVHAAGCHQDLRHPEHSLRSRSRHPIAGAHTPPASLCTARRSMISARWITKVFTILNISATQELSTLVKQQAEAITAP